MIFESVRGNTVAPLGNKGKKVTEREKACY